MDILTRWIEQLAAVLVRFGVPEASSRSGAWIATYVLATILVLLVVLILFRLTRRPGAPSQKPAPAPPVETAETAETAEEKFRAEEEAEADVAEAERASEEVEAAPPAPAPSGVPELPPAPVPAEAEAELKPEAAKAPLTLLDRMRAGLAKTQTSLVGRIDSLLRGRGKVDQDLLEELEEILVAADFGMKTTQDLMQSLQKRLARADNPTPEMLRQWLKEEIRDRLRLEAAPLQPGAASPFVLMVVGVNGAGKTTTIGKLAGQFAGTGKKVILGAGDTFRAAAAEQLAIWGERSGAEVIRHAEGADPAAVAFDSVKAAIARRADILILDTAGRLHTKVNLMEELKKVHRVLDRELPGAPHETLLVLDATTGQNALVQARLFKEAVTVSGIVLTKLDGTARGGMIVAIGSELGLPVRFVGIGEGLDDLRPFDPDLFVEALFQNNRM